jgi:hypothetical protein
MKYPICLSLLAILCLFACNENDKEGPDGIRNSPDGIHTIELRKVVSLSLGHSLACALDDQGHAGCWLHPQKFIPDSPGSKKGHSEIAYPKKSNADLVDHKYVGLAGGTDAICAIRDDAKVLCFIPDDSPAILPSSLSRFGQFHKIAATEQGFFCAINMGALLSCHKLDMTASVAKDDYALTDEVAEIALGSLVLQSGIIKRFGCWVTSKNLLQCELFDDGPEAPQPKEEASRLAKGSPISFSLCAMSKDKKNIKYFGHNRKIARSTQDNFDLTQTYRDIVVTGPVFCGILDPSGEIKCQQESGTSASKIATKTNNELQNERFIRISVGFQFSCGLRNDRTPLCWQPKDLEAGMPENLKAE